MSRFYVNLDTTNFEVRREGGEVYHNPPTTPGGPKTVCVKGGKLVITTRTAHDRISIDSIVFVGKTACNIIGDMGPMRRNCVVIVTERTEHAYVFETQAQGDAMMEKLAQFY